MPGTFGLKEDHHHERVPPDRLVEARPCLDVHGLYREGLFFEGASATLQTAHGGYQLATHEGWKISIGNQTIATRLHGMLPSRVFICPSCGAGRARLYEYGGVWACRSCHDLRYSVRHRFRMIKGFNKLIRLRRKIGASLEPFSPITPKPPYARRYWMTVASIRQLEKGLLQHISADVCDVLERRHDGSQQPGAGDC
jgi:hypothetical protein